MRKALLLDRDGVINEDTGYVHTREAFIFRPGIVELCKQAQSTGFGIFVITNQSGIAREYYTEAQFLELTRWMEEQFLQHGITITRTYYCPHHAEHGKGEYKIACDCRKPKPGMILQAQKEYALDLANSIFIGDQPTDIQAANAAHVGHAFLLTPQVQLPQLLAQMEKTLLFVTH